MTTRERRNYGQRTPHYLSGRSSPRPISPKPRDDDDERIRGHAGTNILTESNWSSREQDYNRGELQRPSLSVSHPHFVELNLATGGGQGGLHRQPTMTDTESQYSQETMVGTEPRRLSTRLSRAFSSLSAWERFKGKGKKRVGWLQSCKAVATFSWINVLLIFIPIAWTVKVKDLGEHILQFLLCFLAIIPLSKLLHYGGEQLALYCGKTIGDLIVITVNNAVETATALVLMVRCQLKLLQSTIIGVVLLRLLLVPGIAFVAGGARTSGQELHPHIAQLNNTLLTLGALTLLLPAAFFGALNHGEKAELAEPIVVTNSVRGDFLKLSRALSIFLLAIYICSRVYLHDPPGGVQEGLAERDDAPESFKAAVKEVEKEEPEVNPWVCVILILTTAVLIGFTTEFLIHSVQPMRHRFEIKEEWFGLFLLPIVSYSADGLLSISHFIRRNLIVQRYLGAPSPTCRLAQGRSIDLGIQFLLFWMPVLVLVAWFIRKPLALIFDLIEVFTLLGACFLVNYVTADAKTNWCEGLMMVTFYLMIGVTAWFYPGQPEVRDMVTCASVRLAVAQNSTVAHSDHYQNLTAHPLPAHMLIHNVTLSPHGNTSHPGAGHIGPPVGGNVSHPVGGHISQPTSATPHQNTLNKRLSRLVKRYGVGDNAGV